MKKRFLPQFLGMALCLTAAISSAQDSPAAGKSILFWPGRAAIDGTYLKQQDFSSIGWKFETGDSKNILTAKPDVYFFRNPSGENKVPAEAWPIIRKNIKEGAIAFFCSYWNYPLATYMDDPTWATKMLKISLLLKERKATRIEPGKWLANPKNLEPLFKDGYMPAQNTSPVHPEYWKALGYMPQTSQNLKEEIPFLLFRPYGKGAVVVLSADPAGIPVPELMLNICSNLDELGKDVKIPPSAQK